MELENTLVNKVISHARKENCQTVRWQVSNWNEKAKDFYTQIRTKIDSVEQNVTLELD